MKRVSKALCLAVSGALAGSLLMAPQVSAETSIPGAVDAGFTFDVPGTYGRGPAGLAAVELGTYILVATGATFESNGLFLVDRQGNRAPDSVFSHNPGITDASRMGIESMHVMPDNSVLILGTAPAYGTGGGGTQPITRISSNGAALPSQILDRNGQLASFGRLQTIALGFRDSDGAAILYTMQTGVGAGPNLRKFVYAGNGTFQEDPGFCPWFKSGAGCTNELSLQRNATILSLLPMPDGGVVVGGGATSTPSAGELPIRPECGYASNGGVIRLNSTGAIDRNWNRCPGSSSGVRRNRAMNSGGYVSELALGRSSSGAEIIFASGNFSRYDGDDVDNIMAITAQNGGISSSFDTSNLDVTSSPTALVTSPSYAGGVLAVGGTAREGQNEPLARGIFRLDSQGQLDRSFMGQTSDRGRGEAPGLGQTPDGGPYRANATLLRDGNLVIVGNFGSATSGAPLQTHESEGAFILKSPMQYGSVLTSGGQPRDSEIQARPATLVGGGDLRPGVSRSFDVTYAGDLDSYPPLPQSITSRTVEVNLVDEVDAPCASDQPQSISASERSVRIQVQVPREGLQPYLCVKQTISTNYLDSTTSSTAYFGRSGVVVPPIEFGNLAAGGYPRQQNVTWSQATRATFNNTYGGAAAYPVVDSVQRQVVRASTAVQNLGANQVVDRVISYKSVASPDQCETGPQLRGFAPSLSAGDVPVTAPVVNVWTKFATAVLPQSGSQRGTGWVCARQRLTIQAPSGERAMVYSNWSATYVTRLAGFSPTGAERFASLEKPRAIGRTLRSLNSVAPGSSFTMIGRVASRSRITPTPVSGQMIVGISNSDGGKCVESSGMTPGTINPSEMAPDYKMRSRWVKVPDNAQGYVCATQTLKNPLYSLKSKTVYIPIEKKGYDGQVPDPNDGGKPGLSGGKKDQGKKKN